MAHSRTDQDTVWATYECFRSNDLLGELSLALKHSSALRSNGWNSAGSGTIAGVQVSELASGIAVFYRAGMDIDADGSPHAYNPENTGLDVNEDALDGSEWVGVVTNDDGNPVIQNISDPSVPALY